MEEEIKRRVITSIRPGSESSTRSERPTGLGKPSKKKVKVGGGSVVTSPRRPPPRQNESHPKK